MPQPLREEPPRRARRGRAIENETFQTLKARDPHTSGRNSGRGCSRLADVLMMLAMPVFLMDQVQRRRCPVQESP